MFNRHGIWLAALLLMMFYPSFIFFVILALFLLKYNKGTADALIKVISPGLEESAEGKMADRDSLGRVAHALRHRFKQGAAGTSAADSSSQKRAIYGSANVSGWQRESGVSDAASGWTRAGTATSSSPSTTAASHSISSQATADFSTSEQTRGRYGTSAKHYVPNSIVQTPVITRSKGNPFLPLIIFVLVVIVLVVASVLYLERSPYS